MTSCIPQLRGPAAELTSEILQSSGLNQAELARRAGIPRSVLNTYLHGKREPGTEALMRIASAAGQKIKTVSRSAPVDPKRASRILIQVLELAEALPFHRSRKLHYPYLPKPTIEIRAL